MTTYVVLKKDGSGLWSELTAQVASSPKAAIRQVIQSTNESGVTAAMNEDLCTSKSPQMRGGERWPDQLCANGQLPRVTSES